MGTAIVSEGRRLHGGGNGNGGNGHAVHDRVNGKKQPAQDGDLALVLDELMRLVDASKEGRLGERGKATLFNGTHREIVQSVNEMLDSILLPIGEGNRILAQISTGKIDELITADLQRRPREDEGRGQQCGRSRCRSCRRIWRG